VAGKRLPSETRIARDVEHVLAERLPKGWTLRAKRDASIGDARIDLRSRSLPPPGRSPRLRSIPRG